jgi:predicted PurR-regulated permease PerM
MPKKMGQLWAKIRANYGLKGKLIMSLNEPGFLNNTTKSQKMGMGQQLANNDKNNEPTKGQNNLGNLASFEFFFPNYLIFSFLLLFLSFFFGCHLYNL